jgi:hypothetical protein
VQGKPVQAHYGRVGKGSSRQRRLPGQTPPGVLRLAHGSGAGTGKRPGQRGAADEQSERAGRHVTLPVRVPQQRSAQVEGEADERDESQSGHDREDGFPGDRHRPGNLGAPVTHLGGAVQRPQQRDVKEETGQAAQKRIGHRDRDAPGPAQPVKPGVP